MGRRELKYQYTEKVAWLIRKEALKLEAANLQIRNNTSNIIPNMDLRRHQLCHGRFPLKAAIWNLSCGEQADGHKLWLFSFHCFQVQHDSKQNLSQEIMTIWSFPCYKQKISVRTSHWIAERGWKSHNLFVLELPHGDGVKYFNLRMLILQTFPWRQTILQHPLAHLTFQLFLWPDS